MDTHNILVLSRCSLPGRTYVFQYCSNTGKIDSIQSVQVDGPTIRIQTSAEMHRLITSSVKDAIEWRNAIESTRVCAMLHVCCCVWCRVLWCMLWCVLWYVNQHTRFLSLTHISPPLNACVQPPFYVLSVKYDTNRVSCRNCVQFVGIP